jgi:hypothetical protein
MSSEVGRVDREVKCFSVPFVVFRCSAAYSGYVSVVPQPSTVCLLKAKCQYWRIVLVETAQFIRILRDYPGLSIVRFLL